MDEKAERAAFEAAEQDRDALAALLQEFVDFLEPQDPKLPEQAAHADEPKRAGFLQQIDACRQSVAQWPEWMRATRLAPEWMGRAQ